MAKADEKRTLADLQPAEYNPRKPTPAALQALAKSMARFGDLSGIVYNRRTKRLVGGHQRHKHMPADAEVHVQHRFKKPNAQGTVAIGWVDIDGERWSYREVDVDESTEKAMNLAANRHGEGHWDYEALPDLVQDIGADLDDLEVLGFTPDEIEVFMSVGFDPGQPQGTLEDHDRDDNEGGGQRLKLTREQWLPVQQLAELLEVEPAEAVARAANSALAHMTAEPADTAEPAEAEA